MAAMVAMAVSMASQRQEGCPMEGKVGHARTGLVEVRENNLVAEAEALFSWAPKPSP